MVVCCEERTPKKHQHTTQSNAIPPQMTADTDHTTQMQESVGGMSAEREEGTEGRRKVGKLWGSAAVERGTSSARSNSGSVNVRHDQA